MTAEVAKHVAYIAVGTADGAVVSKHVAYIVIEPGSEPSAPAPPNRQGFTYAQVLRPE